MDNAVSPAKILQRLPSRDAVGRAAMDSAAIAILLVFAAFLGLLCVYLPWHYVVVLSLATLFPILVWFAPWAGFSMYVLIALVAPDFKISDVATAGMLGILFIKFLASKEKLLPSGDILAPYLVWMASAAISLVLAVVYFRNQIPFIYRDGRSFIYWLWLPAIYWMVRTTPDGTKKLARVLAGLAAFIALVAIFQWFTGIQLVAAGRVGALETAGAWQGDLTRVQMPGYVFVVLALVWVFSALVYGRLGWYLAIPAILILGAAIYVNFGRALWFWTFVSIVLSILVLDLRRAVLMSTSLVIVGGLAVGGLSLLKPEVIDTVATRLLSIRDEGGARTSFGWRKLENDDAIGRIAKSPLVGVGVGGEYRRWIAELRLFEDHTRYVHNSYIFVALKLGVPALLAVLWLLFVCWRKGWRSLKLASIEDRPLKVAGIATLPAILGLSITQPELMYAFSGIFFSCVLVILILGADANAAPTAARKRMKF